MKLEFWDYAVLALYFIIIAIVGYLSTRKKSDTRDYFTASGKIPMWAAAISFMVTAQSAATFLGGPQKSYSGNLSFLAINIGSILAGLIVAYFFIPAFYKHKVTSIYGFLQVRFGMFAGVGGSIAFLLGRILASASRLFIACFAFSYVCVGEVNVFYIQLTIVLMTFAGIAYTIMGGIRAVIWTDVMQSVVYVLVITITLIYLLNTISMSPGEIYDILSTTKVDGNPKLDFFHTPKEDETYWQNGYTFWAIIIGQTVFHLGVYGTDNDLAQRFLTCKNSKEGSKAAILGSVLGLPVQILFLFIGLLLYVLYNETNITAGELPPKGQKVFLHFILTVVPVGIKGLLVAGIFSAALSSINSALNAMSSSFYSDIVKYKYADLDDDTSIKISRISLIVFGFLVGGVAILLTPDNTDGKSSFIDLALMVMVFACSGLLAVFLAGLFTNRGNVTTVWLAIIFGFVSVYLMTFQLTLVEINFYNICYLFSLNEEWFLISPNFKLAFPWKMVVATFFGFLICISVPSNNLQEESDA
ncbi:MAG: hypothetical protein COA79_16185 [Planctomycetota bacterium]|nr:MAG: hypothetical protein COA79_16185 [Planctomycetota bacterium]